MDETEHQELAAQLRQPEGAKGLETAERMNKTNMSMITETIATLDLADDHQILELGPGNGEHVTGLVGQAQNMVYTGLDISETMWAEAQRRNDDMADVSFKKYDGVSIPFSDNEFDRVFTVNTIYFWSDPGALLDEIYRVLKPSGRVAIGFVKRSFMETLPFTKYGFTAYDRRMIDELVEASQFDSVDVLDRSHVVVKPDGESVDRPFSIAILAKKACRPTNG